MTRAVVVKGGPVDYVQEIFVGEHRILADEPAEVGGADAGPNPFELLLAALGTCTSMTVRMYAERKQWPIEDIQISLRFESVYEDDLATSDGLLKQTNVIVEDVSVTGELSDAQRARLLEIAHKCPVHRTLMSPIRIETRLAS